jgi:GAF domain-containing protein
MSSADFRHLRADPARLAHVMEVVRTAARALIGADGVTLVFRDGHECAYVEEDAIGPLWKGQRFPLTECVSGWVIIHETPAVIPDIYADPRVPIDAYRRTFVKSMAMVPIGKANPIGAIGAYWSAPHEATPSQIETLTALADSARLAFDDTAD